MTHANSTIIRGLLWAGVAILIWSGALVMLRLGVTTGLTAYDLTALRFSVAGILLLPILLRKDQATPALGLTGILVLVVLFGAPFVLLLSVAMQTAPASAAGALNPGVMTISSVLMARWIERERLTKGRLMGIALVAGGVAAAVLADGITAGHVILMLTGVMWTGYGIFLRTRRVPALYATAVVAVGSAVIYLPIYLLALPKGITTAPIADVVTQALVQGVLVTTIAVYAFGRSVELLGRVAGTSLPALIPVVTLGLSVLILGDKPHLPEILGACLVTLGIATVIAGPKLASILEARRSCH
ncbi:DMT family transporter [Gallaecimonas mangrovi]|uniref:DMT family transporter n=1 Tax=Gallaecimonas mangrovi TaxID=2291597 RepID=UPI001D00BBEF|nr:DMT family transporter [Gallaecimonas mangrovi]